MELQFRDLLADEIELRVGSTNDSGFQLLLYKNARVDMALLDEVVGIGNWQREHIILGNDIYCRLGVWNKELNQWVWKTDAGSSGSIEEEKSKASDSFKRAATNFGLGRCLYTAPFVWINTKDKNGKPTGEDKKTCRYSVKTIEYKNHKISQLVIINDKTKQIVFSYGSKEKVAQNADLTPKNTTIEEPKPFTKEDEQLIGKFQGFNTQANTIDLHDRTVIESYLNTCEKESQDKFYDYIAKHYGTMVVSKLSELQGKELVSMLKNRK